jgi:hypothetical protein
VFSADCLQFSTAHNLPNVHNMIGGIIGVYCVEGGPGDQYKDTQDVTSEPIERYILLPQILLEITLKAQRLKVVLKFFYLLVKVGTVIYIALDFYKS